MDQGYSYNASQTRKTMKLILNFFRPLTFFKVNGYKKKEIS